MRQLFSLCILLLCCLLSARCTIREVNISSGTENGTAPPPDKVYPPATGASCAISNGIHPASVDYVNTVTGKVYTSNQSVEVTNCNVTGIYYPNRRLDANTMQPAALNNAGEAHVTDNDGRNYYVHITDIPHDTAVAYQPPQQATTGSHLCGHITRRGTPCKHRVRAPGYCWQHR